MSRADPHAGKVPGLGCTCAQCLRPLPPITAPIEESPFRRAAYEAHRRAYREANPIRSVSDGGTKAVRP